MNYQGIIVGIIAFCIIGVFHPIVIKGEYYFSKNIWPVFLILGIIFLGVTLFIHNSIVASATGVLGVTCLWSIKELKEQEERVEKGWFPKNPNRN